MFVFFLLLKRTDIPCDAEQKQDQQAAEAFSTQCRYVNQNPILFWESLKYFHLILAIKIDSFIANWMSPWI